MVKIKQFVANLSKTQKITFSIVILCIIFVVTISIPTFANYKNSNGSTIISIWDGSVASSYHSGSGTENDPYIISDGAELAYLSQQLGSTDYADTYFALNSSIILNNGVLKYDSVNGIEYTIDDETYYVKNYTNEYYLDTSRTGSPVTNGILNIFPSLEGFKGNLNGKFNTVYGLYITDQNLENLALFNDLEGSVSNLHIINAIVYGGNVTSLMASKAINASLSDVLVDGYVISKDITSKVVNETFNVEPIVVETTETTSYIDLNNNLPFVGSTVTSFKIKGNYTITGDEVETLISINGNAINDGSFEIDLGTTVFSQIPVVTSTALDATIDFTDLEYEIAYNYSVASGLIGVATDSIVKNAINKADIYGDFISSGIIGTTYGVCEIRRSYNEGSVNGNLIAGGLIALIEGNTTVTIDTSYNEVNVNSANSGGIIGVVNNVIGTVSIGNVFDGVSNSNVISIVNNGTVNVINSFRLTGTTSIGSGTSTGNFIETNINTLKNKAHLTGTLNYSEYVNMNDTYQNSQNVWSYEEGKYPKLYHKSKLTNVANLHVGMYVFKEYMTSLSQKNFSPNITFGIETSNDLTPIREKLYYISNSNVPLNKNDLNSITTWEEYSGIEQIILEGSYIIYVKIIDYKGNITYLNSDVLELNLLAPSDEEGYTMEQLIMGLDDSINYHNLPIYITDKSVVTLRSSYNYVGSDIVGSFSHNLVTSILLPKGTKINMKDNETGKVYSYQIPTENDDYNYESSCDISDLTCEKIATYPFVLFKEIGSDINRAFVEDSYYLDGFIKENFTFNIDFSKTNIITNYDNVKAYIELRDSSEDIIRTTLSSTIKTFNIYSIVNSEGTAANLYLNSNYNNSSIYFNTESVLSINFSSGLSYKMTSGIKIIDTRYENHNSGLFVEMVDSEGKRINKELYSNVEFKIGSNSYSVSNDNILRIPFESLFTESNITLNIITHEAASRLKAGTYYFKISNYTTLDGVHLSRVGSSLISIPIVVNAKSYGNTYKFNVEMNDESTIMSKSSDSIEATFDVTEVGSFANPNIRVSLYKKELLTAYNQNYILVDLQAHVSDSLNSSGNNSYNISEHGGNQSFSLNFITNKLERNGYKLVFELYDGDEKIDMIKKHFIVK